MREIKFRAWIKTTYWKNGNQRKQGRFIYFDLVDLYEYNSEWDEDELELYHDTEDDQQYTRLKDFGGKEIYEGDIIGWRHEEEKFLGEIIWSTEDAAFLFKSTTGGAHLNEEYLSNFEVIGNIYENPELLGEEE